MFVGTSSIVREIHVAATQSFDIHVPGRLARIRVAAMPALEGNSVIIVYSLNFLYVCTLRPAVRSPGAIYQERIC